ncbi:ankyrin [Apiospora arundinis]
MPISMLKAATILSLLFTAVSIWPSISAASDGRTSKLIAEWTARKDFIENCEAHNWSSAACERSKGIQLDAPPNLDRKTSQKASGVSPGSPILIWYCCQCGGGPMNVATNIHCFCYYQHQRCSYCCVEYSKTRNRMSQE